ncbi:MAG: hypothetical protein ACNS60_19170 [Candidatus Cyclobacteriaceae bacterium M2_1C_046]
MTNTLFIYDKDKLTKWLLTVALFFSIFTFSGYAGYSQSRQQQATQTELVISNNHKTCKRTISFKKAFELTSCNDFLISTYKNWTNTLFTYNILTKVKLDSISKQFCSYKSADRFPQVKTIPKSSDEDIFATFIG